MRSKSLLFLGLLLFFSGFMTNQLWAQLTPAQGYPSNGQLVYENPVFLNFTHPYDTTSISIELQVATNSNFILPVESVTLKDTAWGYSFTTVGGTHYWWRIRSKNNNTGTYTNWVTTDFISFGAADTSATITQPTLGYPRDSIKVYENPVTLNFSHPYAPGVFYNLKLDTLANFTTPIVDVILGNSIYGYTVALQPDKHYYWRVTAYNTNGLAANPVTADFVTASSLSPATVKYSLSLSTTGTGSGTINSIPDASPYDYGTNVQLTAIPDSGSTFVGWYGDASGTTNPLNVSVTSNKSIVAQFNVYGNTGTTYYVRSDGNDANTGLANNAGGAKLTIDSAIAASVASNLSGNTIIVVGDNTTWAAEDVVVNDDSLSIYGSPNALVKSFTVTGNKVTISNFSVSNSGGSGIQASGVSNLLLNAITESNSTDDNGADLTNINGLTVTNSSFNGNGSTLSTGVIVDTTSSNITFNKVSSIGRKDGFNFSLISNGTFKSLTATNNSRYGLALDESSNTTFTDGEFSHNLDGMHIHPHAAADVDAQDTISAFTFNGTVKADSNAQRGIVLMTDATTYIVGPTFSGNFELNGNGDGCIFVTGNVSDPTFSGFTLTGHDTTYGLRITGLSGNTNQPSGVKINNSGFYSFGTTDFNNYAIGLIDTTNATLKYSSNNVDAQNNQWVGLTNSTQIEDRIYHQVDDGTLGLVNFAGYGFGTPVIEISDVTTNTGSIISEPVKLNVYNSFSMNYLEGKIYYDSSKVTFNSITYGTGTLLNDAGWVLFYNDTTYSGSIKLIRFNATGITPINSTGTLFNLGFTVDSSLTAGSTDVTGSQTPTNEWSINGTTFNAFTIQDGTITYYVAPQDPSKVRGDATMNYVVDPNDASAVLLNLSSPFLVPGSQAETNADANIDLDITIQDVYYIEYYIVNNGVWPSGGTVLPKVSGQANSSVILNSTYGVMAEPTPKFTKTDNNNYLMNLPLEINQANGVFALEVTFTYDKNLIDYQTFKQSIIGNGNIAYASETQPGVAKFAFVSGYKYNNNINPGNITFNFKNGKLESDTKIGYTYHINGEPGGNGEIVINPTTTTGVDGNNNLPTSYKLEQNYPNPFNPSTIIRYSVPKSSVVTLKIYNILGQEVKTLVNFEQGQGTYNVRWNGNDNFGRKVASGVYIYRIIAGDFVQVKKMVLMK